MLTYASPCQRSFQKAGLSTERLPAPQDSLQHLLLPPVRIRQHTSEYVSIRQHRITSHQDSLQHLLLPPVRIRQHTSAYVSIRQHRITSPSRFSSASSPSPCTRRMRSPGRATTRHTSAYVSIRTCTRRMRSPGRATTRHTSAYVSIRQHTDLYAAHEVTRTCHHAACLCAERERR
jgi:hypothetical protein